MGSSEKETKNISVQLSAQLNAKFSKKLNIFQTKHLILTYSVENGDLSGNSNQSNNKNLKKQNLKKEMKVRKLDPKKVGR